MKRALGFGDRRCVLSCMEWMGRPRNAELEELREMESAWEAWWWQSAEQLVTSGLLLVRMREGERCSRIQRWWKESDGFNGLLAKVYDVRCQS